MSAGCSYTFVQPPRDDDQPGRWLQCTTNPAAPVIDTVLTATNLASVLYVAGQDNVSNKGQAIPLGLLAASVWLSSAIYGYYNTSKCAEIRDRGPVEPYYLIPHRQPPAPPPASTASVAAPGAARESAFGLPGRVQDRAQGAEQRVRVQRLGDGVDAHVLQE